MCGEESSGKNNSTKPLTVMLNKVGGQFLRDLRHNMSSAGSWVKISLYGILATDFHSKAAPKSNF